MAGQFFPFARNYRRYEPGQVGPRPPLSDVLFNTENSPVTSLARLQDTTPLGPGAGYALIAGTAAGDVYVNAARVASGFSGNRLSIVSYRPSASPQPFAYIGDSVLQYKVNADGGAYLTGIKEPQAPATVANSAQAAPAIASPVFYQYCYRSAAIGAGPSNPSPVMLTGFTIAGFAPSVSFTASTDPQVDTVDFYRFNSALLNYTYCGSCPNNAGPFIDTLDDLTIAANPILQLDNFQPFPSIDVPHSGTVTVNGATVTWVSGDKFNVNWGGGSIISIGGKNGQLYNRPTDNQHLTLLDANAVANIVQDNAGAGANSAVFPAAGTINWVNPGNVTSAVNYATNAITAPVAISFALLATNFGFAIPGGATILGIRFDFEAYCDTADSGTVNQRLEVYIFKAGVDAGGPVFFSPLGTVSANRFAGSSTYLWGTTWTPADINNAGFGPAFVAVGSGANMNFFVRNVRATVAFQPAAGGAVQYQVQAATILNQKLPAWWGPTDNTGYFYACGDSYRPGTLYFTKGNNPDAAPDTNQIEVTSPSEPLMNGCIVNGLGMVFSTERAWWIYPNFANVVATVTGIQGSLFYLIESINDRGLYCRKGLCTDGGGHVYFISKDGIYKALGNGGSSSIVDDIYSLFPHEGSAQQSVNLAGLTVNPPNYANTNGMALCFVDGRLYFDYLDVNGAPWTLVFDPDTEIWSVDTYTPTVTVHAVPLGNAYGTYVGCSNGDLRQMTANGTETFPTVLQPDSTSHDQLSWQSLAELNVKYSSSVPVTISFSPDQGQAIAPLTLATQAAQNKVLTTIGAGKFKLMTYIVSAIGQFRIWVNEFQVKVGGWNRTGQYEPFLPLQVFARSKKRGQ